MFMLREMAQYIALVHFYTGGITKSNLRVCIHLFGFLEETVYESSHFLALRKVKICNRHTQGLVVI